MVKDAETNAAADKERSEQIATKNESEALCYQTKKQLEQLEATASADEKQKIETLISELEEAIKADNYASMKDISENLKKTVMEVGEKAYNAAGANAPENDDVIETDFSAEK